jgi:hypothetical protein
MNSRHLRMVVVGTIAVGLALSQQACTPVPTTAAPGSAAPSAPTATTASTAPKPGQNGDTAAKPAGSGGKDVEAGSVPGCLNKDIDLTVTSQDQAVIGGSNHGLVNLVNISDHVCKLRGNFAVALTNAAGETVKVPTKLVNQPGKAVTVVIQRGGGAFAGIKWTVCDKGDADCGVGNNLRWNLQSSGSGKDAKLQDFPAPEKNLLTMGSLQVGTIQPIRVGVVAW